jgi:hypothetical protein
MHILLQLSIQTFAKTQPLLTRGLGPVVGGTLALYDLETAYPANINPTSSAANMVNTRVNHDIEWVTGLIARFGSNGVSDFLEELKRNVKWQEKAGSSEGKESFGYFDKIPLMASTFSMDCG